MQKKEDADWMEHITCPFCGTDIVNYYNGAEVPEDIDEDEARGGWHDEYGGVCDHLAIFCDGQGPAQIQKKWEGQVDRLGKEMLKRKMFSCVDDAKRDTYVFENIGTEILESLSAASGEISSLLGIEYSIQYKGGISIDRGPACAGSTSFDLLFLKANGGL